MAYGSGTHRCIAEDLSLVELEVGWAAWVHWLARLLACRRLPPRRPPSSLAHGRKLSHASRLQPPPLPQEAFKGLFRRLPGLQLAVPESQLEWADPKGDVGLKALPVKW